MTPLPEDLLRDEIRRAGPMPFARFMETALYHPRYGYYMRGGAHPAGRAGDFLTAPEMSSAFGALVAEFIRTADADWDLWEFGAGSGKLAHDVVTALPEAVRPSNVVLVERHPSARAAAERLAWLGLRAEAMPYTPGARLRARAARAVVLANEFADAFPADVFRRADAGWETLRVALDGDAFVEAWAPTGDAAALAYLNAYASHAERGQRVEMARGLGAWLDTLAALAPRVLALVFDYGGSATEVYAPVKKFGTLACHYRHTADARPFERVGEKDITASVNFSFLEDEARARGFSTRAVALAAFLVQAGAERFLADDAFTGAERHGLLRMLDPTGMGGLFKVCLLARGREIPALQTWRELVGA